MARLLQILYVDENNFIIPYKKIGRKNVLLLNKSHAEICDDSKFYDKSVKLTYDFDKNEWTARFDGSKRIKLDMPVLKEFLNNELKKYVCPNINEDFDFSRIKIKVLHSHLPKKKEISDDVAENKKIVENFIRRNPHPEIEDYINKARSFVQTRVNTEIFNTIQDVNNISEFTYYKMLDSIIDQLGAFVYDDSICELRLKMTDGTYFIDTLFYRS